MTEIKLNQTCYATLGMKDPWSIKTYREVGGYSAWESILTNRPPPEEVVGVTVNHHHVEIAREVYGREATGEPGIAVK